MGSEKNVCLLNKKDVKSFKLFFESFYPSLCIFANKYLNDIDASEDIAQGAFIKFWDGSYKFNHLSQIKSFLYESAYNACLNYLRHEDVKSRFINSSDINSELSLAHNILEEETIALIHKLIKDLPRQSYKIVHLSMLGLKNPEIADQLDVSVNTVKTLKKNAYKVLRERLKGNVYLLFVISQILK